MKYSIVTGIEHSRYTVHSIASSFEEIVFMFTVYIRASLTFPRHPSCHICPPLWGCAAPWPPPWASPWSWPCQTVSRAAWWRGWRGWRAVSLLLGSPLTVVSRVPVSPPAAVRGSVRALTAPRRARAARGAARLCAKTRRWRRCGAATGARP